MYNYFTLIFLLSNSLFGQNLIGLSALSGTVPTGTRVSGLHNHWAIPIDGGKLWAWDMYSPTTSDCTSTHFLANLAAWTGSGSNAINCGGTSAATAGPIGITIAGSTSFIFTDSPPSVPNGWTISVVFNSSTLTGAMFSNFNGANTILQYNSYAGAHVFLGYSPGGGHFSNTFETSTNFNVANIWQANTLAYTSASATSAKLWYNNTSVAGTWTGGTGTSALPGVQAETDFGAQNGNDNQFAGIFGFGTLHDHAINASAQGFIYRAEQRAMQFRHVALP
jgi:hypothetical protein